MYCFLFARVDAEGGVGGHVEEGTTFTGGGGSGGGWRVEGRVKLLCKKRKRKEIYAVVLEAEGGGGRGRKQ